VLRRLEFRTVGGQEEELHSLGEGVLLAQMSAGSVQDQQQAEMGAEPELFRKADQ
jgi:hypothetical protein